MDLHAFLGGTLTAITLKGKVIRRMGPDHPDLAEEARGLADLARDARAEVRAADDGVPVTGEITSGTGLRSIAERCARLGGQMRVEADQGGRFTLTCRVPE
ncbi:hypothetical protein ACIQFP_16585 [Nocardiopsis alba]|uniref:hypothetical protein n=1 Tax=Nocardiopsis alba TaxID=53437 RepID=UPI0033D15EA7